MSSYLCKIIVGQYSLSSMQHIVCQKLWNGRRTQPEELQSNSAIEACLYQGWLKVYARACMCPWCIMPSLISNPVLLSGMCSLIHAVR